MGKASRFFKSLLGFKTTDSPQPRSDSKKPLKRRWSFVKSRNNSRPSRHRETSKSIDATSIPHHHHGHRHRTFDENEDSNKRAIAIAAATAAVVDAAVATAQAAAEVVRMTSRTAGYGVHEQLAAIKIQSCFRAYLARRARRALKALVRLQAVVRGHILRKQTADMMRRLQALIRAQARARALRFQITDHSSSTTKPSSFHHHGPPTPEKLEHVPHTKHHHSSISKRNISKSYARGQERAFQDGSMDHEHDKIVEVDTVEPHVMFNYGRRILQPDQISFGHSQSVTTSRGSTFQPTSSSPCASCEINSFDGSVRSCLSGYSEHHPNYMAYTESSRAKVRSLSAPRLRTQLEANSSIKRDSGYKQVAVTQQAPTMRDSFAKKGYPGSGRLDQLGMPVYDTVESELYESYWN